MTVMTEIDSTARFNDFKTVDWVEDRAKEQHRRQSQHSYLSGRSSWVNWLYAIYEPMESWIVLLLVGVSIGLITASISIATEWLSDIKLGVCSTGWWLNQKFCCWESITPGSPMGSEEACAEWMSWDQAMFGHDWLIVRWLAFIATGTLFATVCAYLVRCYAPYAAGSGLPEIKAILNGFVIRGFMGGWTLLMKSVGLALAVGSGLSIGKEGPAVHIGCCVGNVISRNFFKYRQSAARRREIVSAAAAAGVAVAFGAPIGGVLFSLEDLSTHFPRKTLWRSFFCALMAIVSLQAMNPFRTGKLVMFQATYDRNWLFFELLFFAMLGVFGGVFGGLCIKLHLKVAAWRKKHIAPEAAPMEVAVLALVTTTITFMNRYTREDMGEMMSYLLQECDRPNNDSPWTELCLPDSAGWVIWWLLWATVLRAAGTVVAYGCKVPCGIFVPSMAIGASFGRMLGTVVEQLQRNHPKWALFAHCPPDSPCITPAAYAFLGAAAAMCGVTKVTVAVVVIMYELTGALNFIVPTMIVVMIARVIGDAIIEGGVSEQLMLLNGLPLLDEAEQEAECLRDTCVSEIMRSVDQLAVLTSGGTGMRCERVQQIIEQEPRVRGFPVVNNYEELRLVGYVHRESVHRCLAAALAASHPTVRLAVNDAGPFTVRPRMAAETVAEIFSKLGPRVILVANDDDDQFLGLLTQKDMLRYTRQYH